MDQSPAYISGTISGEGMKQRKGVLSSVLDNKGYGWLLDVEEEEEDQKPLLYVHTLIFLYRSTDCIQIVCVILY